jgi:hypothetical protein
VPDLVLKETGEVVTVAPANLARALASGLYQAPEAGATTQVASEQGLLDVPVDQAPGFQAAFGDRAATPGEVGQLEREAYLENRHGGALSAVGTFVEQAANEATFGATGFLGEQVLGEDYREGMEQRAELHDTAATAGGIAGLVGTAIASGGTGFAAKVAGKTGAGGAARLAEAIVAKGAGKGLAAETATAIAGYGVEGALLGSGHVLAETVLHDKELSAEAFLAGAKEGAFWGGAGGGAGSLLSRGTRWGKSKLDDVMEKRQSVTELAAAEKAALKDADLAAKEASKLRLQNQRHLNQSAMEELRQKGRLDLVDARGSAKKEAIEYTAEQKLKLEEYRLSGKKELAEIGAESRLKLAELGSETKLKIADTQLEKALAQADAKAAVARARANELSERLAVEQERTARAKLVMDGRLELADTYTSGWRRAADSREAVAASKLEAAAIGADARTRVGLAEALTKSGRSDAGMLIEEMIPARLRSPKAVQAARAEVATAAQRLAMGTDDLVRQADELMAVNPAAGADLRALREAAAETTPALGSWSEKAIAGADDFADGFPTIRRAEEAQHDLAQALKMHLDEAGMPSQHLDAATKGMDDAVGKTDDIMTDAMAKQVKAAAGSATEPGAAAGVADMLLSTAGLPNTEDIPVVGPLMGAYLKMRAAAGALGKFGIRLPGPVGKIASIGATVQNKASEVVQAIVTHAPAAAKVVERAAPSITATMSRPLWEPVGDDKPDAKPVKGDPFRLYKKRLEELDRALDDPDATRQQIIDSIPAPPLVAQAIADTKMRQLEYLASIVDHDPRAPTALQSKGAPVSMAKVKALAEAKRACEDPVGSVKDIVEGRASPKAAEAIKAVFPRLFQQMQEELLEKLAVLETPLPYAKLLRTALVFDIPINQQTTPRYAADRQAEYVAAREAAKQPTPSGGPQLRLSNQEELGMNRRAMR